MQLNIYLVEKTINADDKSAENRIGNKSLNVIVLHMVELQEYKYGVAL
jgi:hypothetical protein